MGEIIHTQHAFFPRKGGYYAGALWESEAAQCKMENVIEVIQMGGRRGALSRETIANGCFGSN